MLGRSHIKLCFAYSAGLAGRCVQFENGIHMRADLKLVLALEHFIIKIPYLSWRLDDRFQNVIDGRNGLSRENTTTLKNNFPKSI